MTINLRKNIARFIYIIDQTTDVDGRAKVLKELGLSENEFQELVSNLIHFSNSADREWYLCNPGYHGFVETFKIISEKTDTEFLI